MIFNYVLCVVIVILLFAVLFLVYRSGSDVSYDINLADKLSIDSLTLQVRDAINVILNTNVNLLNLPKQLTESCKQNKKMLRRALKDSKFGDLSAKEYVITEIKDLLERKFKITEENIDEIFPFTNRVRLSVEMKFMVVLYLYEKKYKREGLTEMFVRNKLDKPIGSGTDTHYAVYISDITTLYDNHYSKILELDYLDKLNIVAQQIYQRYNGSGVLDKFIEMNIDGFSAGVSGVPESIYIYGEEISYGATTNELPLTDYNSVWIMFRGKQIRLAFLGMKSLAELKRVVTGIYRYENPGTLSAEKGYIVNHLRDGSRVVCVRPPFAESYACWVRKFDVACGKEISALYPDTGHEKLQAVLEWLMRGCMNVAITGQQGCGKSTLLMSVIEFMPKTFTVRTQEIRAELNLRKLFRRRNIMGFFEAPSITGQMGIDLQKKTDGSVNVIGEIAQQDVATLGLQTAQVGSNQLIFTHHANSARDLIAWFRDAMIQVAGFSDEKLVESTVASLLRFNVHLNKTVNGHRYIERITEIVKTETKDYSDDLEEATKDYYYRMTDRGTFKCYDILRYEDGRYVFCNVISEDSYQDICSFLTLQEKEQFNLLMKAMEEEVGLN